ncbi:MAG: SH3 domain-containing protein [Treponema sp.]|nr:SH3 domain-containing protein [Treponema sp.]
MAFRKSFFTVCAAFAAVLSLSSCSRLGWGILLWSTDEPPIPSGAVLPVYIKSNINQVWVVGVPETYRTDKEGDKIEIPLPQFEFSGSRRKAEQRAGEFAEYAGFYAENLQDGLPIREHPDNNARRVYRLRTGEIIKILSRIEGVPAISATGEPLPGDWYKVLTWDGTTGYCFSYRLKIFEQGIGSVQSAPAAGRKTETDPDLDMVLARVWSPESYQQMVNSKRLNISELEKHWRFDPGQDTGTAKIILPDMKKEFVYESIYPDGDRAWRFEGTTLQMNLRTNTTLVVQFTEGTGGMRTLLFAALSADVDDLIIQENARRESQLASIVNMGPKFTSNNYGTVTFSINGEFEWTGYDLLVPQLIPSEAAGNGNIFMDLFIAPSFEEHFTGAFTLRFAGVPAEANRIRFMYSLDNQGLRLEVVPDYAIEEITVTRRSSSPIVLYFFRDESP